MSRIRLSMIAAAFTLGACTSSTPPAEQKTAPAPAASTAAAAPARVNPLLSASTLPFQAPPFDVIRDGDFQPALEEGMRQQRAEVAAIAANPAPPTFNNTLVALEKTGQTLNRVNLIFSALSGANTDPTLQKVQELMAPRFAAQADAIYLDPRLFARIEAVYRQRASLHLDPEALRLVEVDYRQFVHAGARLADADKAKLKQLNEQESTLSAKFVNQLLAANKAGALAIGDKSALAGLGEGQLAAASQDARARGLKDTWLLPLQNTTQQPALQSLSDRATRQHLFEASWTRTEHGDANDTRATIARLAQVRAEKAGLLGFPDYAAWKLEDQMAKTPAAVDRFLAQLVPPATAKARAEAAAIQAVIDRRHGGFKLAPWDWDYYAEQVRKARYDLDESQIRPYFELDRVLKDGVFYTANQLYGITFKERHDLPVYQPDVRVFEVFDHGGAPLGLIYFDYFKRDNKSGGAWMDNLVGQSKLLGTLPVVYNVANFTKPAPGQPALLSFSDVTTMFHEFGHALHGLFADQEYPSLSGTNVARDFVEFPSQFNEHWALDPAVLAHYAIDARTGQPMPAALVAKIRKAADFNQGYALTEALAAAELDMQWHTLPADAPLQDVDRFETAALRKTHVDLPQVPPRYRSSYFMHIWGNGYAAGYYAYQWSEMLDDDAFAWFEAHGGLTRANGQRFRDMILSRGNSEDLATLYRAFLGRDPSIGPMLKDRGLQ
ncbi:MAG: peptidyl-dipeptidase Dcp [Xanthomonadaceae bacterium]|nr:peptidyl-dipeptidase Dcp [Xanthomonadaceae bacterium]MDE1958776.1 peptidyl-dipeptidase Dcp [Xanthomonadaceae bacterium]MDE2178537.1 peptidyl-dipeptidase Dcp [Xanthomonadaceae bacterium]